MTRAFISHISEEAQVAATLKELIDDDFLSMLEVFVSSDGESIASGEDWLKSINKALQQTKLLIVLCSPISVRRPWINFELGAAWMLNVPIIPLCHAGLTTRDLPMPLSLRQGLVLTEAGHLSILYTRIAGVLNGRAPKASFEKHARKLADASEKTRIDNAAVELRELRDNRGITKRMNEALNSSKFRWRTLERIAYEASISQDVAADLLRADDSVRFSKGKTGKIIVGLKSRVG